ncbi:MAG: hypothetical protein AB7O44_33295 [Hyphomicrobiaceae bacterium]
MNARAHRIEIEPVGLGDRGHRYRATHEGSVLIDGSRHPEFDACRALLARGIRGKLEVWRKGAAFPAMVLDIEAGARLTVAETEAAGPRFVRWKPFSVDDDQNAVLSSTGQARTAVSHLEAPSP